MLKPEAGRNKKSLPLRRDFYLPKRFAESIHLPDWMNFRFMVRYPEEDVSARNIVRS
jgi:hypothetical protein